MATSTISSTTRPVTSSTTIQPPVYRPEEYTIAGVVLKFFEEKAKDVAKTMGYTAFWVGQALPDLPPQVKSFSTMMGDFKNFVSATEVPKKAMEAGAALTKLWTDLTNKSGSWQEVGKTAWDTFKKSALLVNSTVDGIDFSTRFISIDAAVMTWLKGINFVATIGGCGMGAAEQIQNFAKAEASETHKKILYVINLARDVSYFALGVIGLFFIVTATPVVPWMMVACLTSGLTFTIGGYFYEKLYDPEGKGKNLNPEAVIANNQARKDYEQRLARA